MYLCTSMFSVFSWLQGIDGRPGFNKQSLEHLSKQTSGENACQYRSCSLMIDGICIRKLMQYDPSAAEFTGLVNFGNALSIDTSDEDLATEALVFLAVGITGRGKQVIVYAHTRM